MKTTNEQAKIGTVFCVILAMYVSGCATSNYNTAPYKAYNGPDKPMAEIATLHATPPAFVSKVDELAGSQSCVHFKAFAVAKGKMASSVEGQIIQLLPGRHTIVLNYRESFSGAISVSGTSFNVTLEAGKNYEITATRGKKESLWPIDRFPVTYGMHDANSGAAIPLQSVTQ